MTLRQLHHLAKIRIGGAFEYLRTGRCESFDEFERINQAMHEIGGFADRQEAAEWVADEVQRLWDAEYPSPWAYWEEPRYHELSHLAFKDAWAAGGEFRLLDDESPE